MQKQQGAVLVISMIILLLLTILGVTSMRTTQLEERMAGNARDRLVAFEAAEAALIDAEILIQTLPLGGFDLNGNDGLYNDDPILGDIANYVVWDGSDATKGFITASNIGTAEGLGTAPKYVIQRILPGTTFDGLEDPSTGRGYGAGTGGSSSAASTLVRITARGTGGSDNSVVFLQTIFGVDL